MPGVAFLSSGRKLRPVVVHTDSRFRYAALLRYCMDYAFGFSMLDETGFYAPSVAHNAFPSRPWLRISVLHGHNPTVSKQLRYSLNQMHMRMPWRCRGLQMLMHIYCGELQIPHGDKPMDFASSSVTSVSLFFKVRQPAR